VTPNGLRLSGARKGVRCSRGLGRTLLLSPVALAPKEPVEVLAHLDPPLIKFGTHLRSRPRPDRPDKPKVLKKGNVESILQGRVGVPKKPVGQRETSSDEWYVTTVDRFLRELREIAHLNVEEFGILSDALSQLRELFLQRADEFGVT